jgi:hypothetical protein
MTSARVGAQKAAKINTALIAWVVSHCERNVSLRRSVGQFAVVVGRKGACGSKQILLIDCLVIFDYVVNS